MTKVKCALIHQPGGPAGMTLVKFTPVDLPAGDILLGFSEAKVEHHPGEVLKDPKGNVADKIMIHPNSLITVATVSAGRFELGGVYDLALTASK
jgi:hypothetical protein